jgi:hypothetical protein
VWHWRPYLWGILFSFKRTTLLSSKQALSRRDEETMESHALSSPSFAVYSTLRDELNMHPRALQLSAQLTEGTAPVGWFEVDGILM